MVLIGWQNILTRLEFVNNNKPPTMKALSFLLLVINLVFVFYIQSGYDFNSSKQLRPELQPEKIKLLPTPTPTP